MSHIPDFFCFFVGVVEFVPLSLMYFVNFRSESFIGFRLIKMLSEEDAADKDSVKRDLPPSSLLDIQAREMKMDVHTKTCTWRGIIHNVPKLDIWDKPNIINR